jgi:hypothetical protein
MTSSVTWDVEETVLRVGLTASVILQVEIIDCPNYNIITSLEREYIMNISEPRMTPSNITDRSPWLPSCLHKIEQGIPSRSDRSVLQQKVLKLL